VKTTETGAPVEAWRRLALYLLMFGMLGVSLELILLGHTEESWQWIPIVLLGVGLVMAGLATYRPTRRIVEGLRALMILYLPAAALGLFLHLRSNLEFELELRPSMAGLELVWETLTGAMPALAPGTMAQLGLLGLLACFRHPAARDSPE
jgi:hypothetical protein